MAESLTPRKKEQDCGFNARVALTRRRAAGADPHLSNEDCQRIVRTIDDARQKHEEETGCDCYQQAMKENPSAFA